MVDADHVDIPVQRVHALDIETQREPVLLARQVELRQRTDQRETIGMGQHPAAIRGQRGQRVLPVHDVETDVDADVIDAPVRPFLQQAQVDLRTRKHAGVRVPNQRVLVQTCTFSLHNETYT